MLNITNINVIKKGKTILSDISFNLLENEILCVLGSNGVGKSTLLKAIIGNEKVISGESFFNNYNLIERKSKEVFNQIGVFFNHSFYDHLTGKENLEIRALLYNLPKVRVRDAILFSKLHGFENNIASTYSSGIRQRLSLALTFLHQPKLIILDEPFVALDLESINHTIEFIKTINYEFGCTFIITSHTLHEVEKFFTRLMILKSTKIISDINKTDVSNFLIFEFKNDDVLLNKHKENSIGFITQNEKTIVLSSLNHEQISNPFRKATVEDIYLIMNNNEKSSSL